LNRVVFVFPGQGSQYTGMGQELAAKFSEAAEVFVEAESILGWPVGKICFNGPDSELGRTDITQPAVLTTSIACLQVLKAKGIVPSAVTGHSLGEYSALVAAGSLAFCDALRVVEKRARLMSNAFPDRQGGMVAVLGLPPENVVKLCQKVQGGVAEPANFNAPGQVVVAGDRDGLAEISMRAKEAGAKKVIPLNVSGPFHSSLMEPASREMAAVLEQVVVDEPDIPVVANVTADYVSSSQEIKENLIKQVSSPVRWEDSIRRLLTDGHKVFIEVGPGNVLSGLIKRIDRQAVTGQVDSIQSLEKSLALLQEAK